MCHYFNTTEIYLSKLCKIKVMHKKVLIEASAATYKNLTGIGYYVKNILLHISKSNKVDYFLYYFNFLGRKDVQLETKLSSVIIKAMPSKILSIGVGLGFRMPIELFIRKKYDFILYTNYVALNSFRKTNYGLFVYDMSYLDCPDYMNEKNRKYLQKFCSPSITNSSLIFTISEFTKQRILYHFPDLNVPIAITPIPPIKQLAAPRKDLQFFDLTSGKFILYMGTVEPRKNIINLLKAYSLLNDKIQEKYTLVIAGGKGWKNEDIHETINKMRDDGLKIVVTGYVSDEEKSWLYNNCACFVMPSHYEGFGMPILEAMQYNAKIAVSNIEVFKEIAGNSIHYFDKDDPEKIANTIYQTLKTAPDIHSYEKIINNISWSKNASIINKSIENVFNI
jgi:glycosyltransferase involved in cell wall biosynthesis